MNKVITLSLVIMVVNHTQASQSSSSSFSSETTNNSSNSDTSKSEKPQQFLKKDKTEESTVDIFVAPADLLKKISNKKPDTQTSLDNISLEDKKTSESNSFKTETEEEFWSRLRSKYLTLQPKPSKKNSPVNDKFINLVEKTVKDLRAAERGKVKGNMEPMPDPTDTKSAFTWLDRNCNEMESSVYVDCLGDSGGCSGSGGMKLLFLQ